MPCVALPSTIAALCLLKNAADHILVKQHQLLVPMKDLNILKYCTCMEMDPSCSLKPPFPLQDAFKTTLAII